VLILLRIREATYKHSILLSFFILHKWTFFNKLFFNKHHDMDWIFLKSTIFCNITPCSPLTVKRRFGGPCRLHLQGRKTKGRLTLNGLQSIMY
jgi:hypothetical protein